MTSGAAASRGAAAEGAIVVGRGGRIVEEIQNTRFKSFRADVDQTQKFQDRTHAARTNGRRAAGTSIDGRRVLRQRTT